MSENQVGFIKEQFYKLLLDSGQEITDADSFLEELITLLTSVLIYSQTAGIVPSSLEMTGAEYEDAALKTLELPSVDAILTWVVRESDLIEEIILFIQSAEQLNSVALPPDAVQDFAFITNPDIIHPFEVVIQNRILVLIHYFIDLSICELDDIQLRRGEVSEKQLRQMPYYELQVSRLNRILLICDEKGNTTFIFDTSCLPDNLDPQDLMTMTKNQLKKLCRSHIGFGTWIKFSNRWQENIAAAMFSALEPPVPKTSTRAIEGFTYVNDGEWRGFWVDQDGNHWSSRNQIQKKMRIPITTIESLIRTNNIPGITRPGGIGREIYCYESIEAAHDLVLQRNQESDLTPATDPRWRGFYLDSEGRYWGSSNRIAQTLGLTTTYLNALIRRTCFEQREVIKGAKKKIRVLLFDAVRLHDQVIEYQNCLIISEFRGDFAFFVAGSGGEHYGARESFARRFNVNRDAIHKLIKKYSQYIRVERVRYSNTGGGAVDGYCLEDFLAIEEVQFLLSLPRVNIEGEWRGFYIDDAGKKWATLLTMARALDVSEQRMSYQVHKRNIPHIMIISVFFRAQEAYDFEAVRMIFSD